MLVFGGSIFLVSFLAARDPWKIERWESQLENYRPERYVVPKNK
jgi:hypothetical protein